MNFALACSGAQIYIVILKALRQQANSSLSAFSLQRSAKWIFQATTGGRAKGDEERPMKAPHQTSLRPRFAFISFAPQRAAIVYDKIIFFGGFRTTLSALFMEQNLLKQAVEVLPTLIGQDSKALLKVMLGWTEIYPDYHSSWLISTPCMRK